MGGAKGGILRRGILEREILGRGILGRKFLRETKEFKFERWLGFKIRDSGVKHMYVNLCLIRDNY